ncbi:MAG: rRNA maturation RNase YbeY, partial [Piscirickettsiaceae bacterium]|nr:rRNA maturation RNase YbeY [Piscirickettsiaceae bacterium]
MAVIVDVQQVYLGTVPEMQLIQQWAESALQKVAEDCELSIRLVDEIESADLNATYRGKTGPTNVLSFPFESDIELTPVLLGDLVICVPVVEREAGEQTKLREHHWAHMVIHGCLHLLGYDHIDDADAV